MGSSRKMNHALSPSVYTAGRTLVAGSVNITPLLAIHTNEYCANAEFLEVDPGWQGFFRVVPLRPVNSTARPPTLRLELPAPDVPIENKAQKQK